jgi:hypothetical protein
MTNKPKFSRETHSLDLTAIAQLLAEIVRHQGVPGFHESPQGRHQCDRGGRSHSTAPADPAEREMWLDEIVPLNEAARLRGVHSETLRRMHLKGLFPLIRRSRRLWGSRRRDALGIPDRGE